MPTIYDQHGFPITTVPEMAEVISKMSYSDAQEALYLLEDNLASRQGIFAGEDQEWAGLDLGAGESERDAIDWDSCQRAAQLSYKYWVHNPLIRRGTETITQYVFGRGFSITAEDPDVSKRAREMWANSDVQGQMAGAKGIHRHASLGQVQGNLFFALFPPGSSVKKVRRFEMSQIHRVLYDRWGDAAMWLITYRDPEQGASASPVREWVRSIYFKDSQMAIPSGEEEASISNEYFIQHITFGTLIGTLGLPTYWPGLAWAKAYKGFLEDFAVISRAYRTFAWKVTGSNFDSLSSAQNMLSDGFARADQSAYGTGRAATIPNAQSDIAPIRTANYTTPADGGRRLALMCMAAFGLPETYFSDVSVGTYATGATIERPVELMMTFVQEVWAREIETMLAFLIDGSPGNEKKITVTFPPILEHDVLPLMQALKTASELEYRSMLTKDVAVQVMQGFGLNDIEDKLAKMDEDGYFGETKDEIRLKLQQKYTPEPAPGSATGSSTSARALGKNYPRKDKPKGQGMPRPRSS